MERNNQTQRVGGVFLGPGGFDPHDLGIFVVIPRGTPFDYVERAVRTKLHGDRALEFDVGRKRFELLKLAFGIEANDADPASLPIKDEERAIELQWDFAR